MRFNADAEEEEPELSSDWQAEAQCHLVLARLRIRQKLWGGQSCPQPPFRRLFPAMSDFVARQGRLKAGCSQDWLPHNLCRIAMASKTKWHWAEAYPTNAGNRRETGEHGGSGEKRPRMTGFVRL